MGTTENTPIIWEQEGQVRINGQKVQLTATEYRLLQTLYENANQLVTKGGLVTAVWGAAASLDMYTHPLNSLLYRVRRKLKLISNNPIRLITKYGEGYTLSVPIQPSLPNPHAQVQLDTVALTIPDHAWTAYPSTYRLMETKVVAWWIERNLSGCVINMNDFDEADFFGFLCYHSAFANLVEGSLTRMIISLSDLPDNDPNTFYRTILRAFYEQRDFLDTWLQEQVMRLYKSVELVQDAFVSQSALREVLVSCRAQGLKVVLFLPQFGSFFEKATPQLMDALYNLHWSFRKTLCYVVGLRSEPTYMKETNLYRLLDTHTHWLGPLGENDTRFLTTHYLRYEGLSLTESQVQSVYSLTGGYPYLIQAICNWLLSNLNSFERDSHLTPQPPIYYATNNDDGTFFVSEMVEEELAQHPMIQHRLSEMWERLSSTEQSILYELSRIGDGFNENTSPELVSSLIKRGLCQSSGQLPVKLLRQYVLSADKISSGGKIWLNKQTNELYQGEKRLDLTALELSVLTCLVRNANRFISQTDLIMEAWPEVASREGVTNDSVYQVIHRLREKIEPIPSKPKYIVSQRGYPEGGYRFDPDGLPK